MGKLLLFAMVVVAAVSRDDLMRDKYISTADFIARCQSDQDYCTAFVQEDQDEIRALNILNKIPSKKPLYPPPPRPIPQPQPLCLPEGRTRESMAGDVVVWLSKHPELAEETATKTILTASYDLWPCPQ